MRIKSITVRNYRVHRELSVQLDGSRTLVGGPNESGKSTLVEAVHRALFLKSKVTGDVHRSMQSSSHAGTPEVEVGFTVGVSDYLVAKKFAGNAGTTRLVRTGGETWSGEEAESRLASLLKVESVSGGRGVADRVAQQWSHLWVWQGESGKDPSEHANLQKTSLLQRLQEIGGAAALQSELDAQVAARVAEAQGEFFTQTGNTRTNSALDKAEKEAANTEALRLNAVQRLGKVEDAAVEFEAQTAAIDRAVQNQASLKEQQTANNAKLDRVAVLRQQEASQAPGAEAAHAAYEAQLLHDGTITNLREEIRTLEEWLQPQQDREQALTRAHTNASDHANDAALDHEQAANRARQARLRRELADAWVTRFESELRQHQLTTRQEQVNQHQQRMAALQEDLAKLPAITAAQVTRLRSQESQVNTCEATLRGMAASIEVMASDQPVRLGEALLGAGERQVITESAEVTVGNSVRLRISPGGGTSLQEARDQLQEARRQLGQHLEELLLGSLAEAESALVRRTDLSGQIEFCKAALDNLDAGNLPAELTAANQAAIAATAQVERRMEQVQGFVAPATLDAARHSRDSEDKALSKLEQQEFQAKSIFTAATEGLRKADQDLTTHCQSIVGKNNDLTGLRAQLNLLLKTHGDDEVRTKALKDALREMKSAEADLATTRNELAELQPHLLERDRQRFVRSLEAASAARSEAETRRAVALAALLSDGSNDPEADLALATAQARSAREHLASIRRKVEGIRLLNHLFLEEQHSLAEQFTKPFAERIEVYLQCLFGAGARVAVAMNENTFQGLQLVRPAQGGGAVSFEHLSGGAREQVAAAVRLAMAEVLAADHDGCLPVVLDDAFAYSDPERVQTLQRMLDLAALHGLQLLVLTCNPADYAGLGARQIPLSRERSTLAAAPLAAPAASEEPTEEEEQDGEASNPSSPLPEAAPSFTPIPEGHGGLLLTRLQEAGGKAGNNSLRQSLGWDEAIYNAVKNSLINTGQLIPGRGRGGTVTLRDREQT